MRSGQAMELPYCLFTVHKMRKLYIFEFDAVPLYWQKLRLNSGYVISALAIRKADKHKETKYLVSRKDNRNSVQLPS